MEKNHWPVEERQLIINRWNVEFAHRPTADYFKHSGWAFLNIFNWQKILVQLHYQYSIAEWPASLIQQNWYQSKP
jgi:hypothetical protein